MESNNHLEVITDYKGYKIEHKKSRTWKHETNFYLILYPDDGLSAMAYTSVDVCKKIIDLYLKKEYERIKYQAA